MYVTVASGVASGSLELVAADCVLGCVTARKLVVGANRRVVGAVVTTGGGPLSLPLSRSHPISDAAAIIMISRYPLRIRSLPRSRSLDHDRPSLEKSQVG